MNRRDLLTAGSVGALVVAAPALAEASILSDTKASGAPTIQFEPKDTFYDRLREWTFDQELDGKADVLVLDRAGFKYMKMIGEVYYIPSDDRANRMTVPTFNGHHIRVPGSALA